ncbi:YoaK family protein [Amycolatopsis taiwanensis]|uniref:Membrane protein n=1 Tax=Amycolatopsis taiwanensis TaxID=342230 RepID=A0A9W6VGG2_9PSEU|nr:YoaK family protein [Amycolatopsis taiwanensis]GLY65934.1 membrane protein [Amycolatopsis taiwanensis]
MNQRRHGPLPHLLVVLTLVTGLVDATSFLGLGTVFVANQTGNVVLLGFALGGAAALPVLSPLIGLVSFAVGAILGRWLRGDRGRLLTLGAAIEGALAAVALVLVLYLSNVYAPIVPLGLAMGLQNALVRRLAVPDLNTTVITSTLTGLLSEPLLGGQGRAGRRATSVAALFVGALIGGVLVTYTGLAYTLGLAVLLLAAVGAIAYLLTRRGGEWLVHRS